MANIKADEISKILREQIANYEQTVAVDEVGSIISVGDGIARIHGLDKVMAGEMLAFPRDIFGQPAAARVVKLIGKMQRSICPRRSRRPPFKPG